MAFIPALTFNLATGSPQAFNKFLDEFETWRAAQKRRPIDLTNRWVTVTPELAEAMLLCSPLAGNRRPNLNIVKYYARIMRAGAWQRTGQAIIFNTDGKLEDAFHRLLAAYLGQVSFDSFLIGDVPVHPTLFAFIDNGRPRSPADALSTAGFNGLSRLLAQVVNIAVMYEGGHYTASSKRPMDKLMPVEVIAYVSEHENLRLGARLMAGEHASATKVIGYPDVAAFVAFQVLELHDEATLDGFMSELGHHLEVPVEGSPIAALQKVLKDDERAERPMKKHQVLGHIIKAFNSWVTGESVKKITLRVNEAFPRFVEPAPMQEAAE